MSIFKKVFFITYLFIFGARKNYALDIVKRKIDQKKFQGPCGCIALICASRFSNKKKKITALIVKAKKTRKNLLSTAVLASIAYSADLNLYCLTLDDDQPMVLGGISYNAIERTSQQARVEKTKNIIFDFKYFQERKVIHFICHLSCGSIDHGFLITIDKQKNILYYHVDRVTQHNALGVNLYVKTLTSWYENA